MKKVLFAGLIVLFAFSACKKDNDDTKAPDMADSTWQFTAGKETYKGTFIFADYSGNQLLMTGPFENGVMDTIISLSITFPGNKIQTGTFPTKAAQTFLSLSSIVSGEVMLGTNPTASRPIAINNIKVNTYDTTTKVISGSFSGEAYNTEDAIIKITNGAFKATVTQ